MLCLTSQKIYLIQIGRMVINMHISVLLEESIAALNLKDNGIYVDCTLGYAGHSSEILKRVRRGCLFAFDQDSEAIAFSDSKLSKISNNYVIINDNFSNIKKDLKEKNVDKVDGILFDLGVSSPQLDNAARGFSYHNDAKLDMRMNREQKLSAYDVVNLYPKEKLIKIFFEYGEEKFAKSIANNIVKYRENKKIETTLELVEIIKNSMPEKAKREKHPARRVFQAIRIEVNNELEVLEKAVRDSLELLNIGGRLVVITFHSLEDRIVKNIFKEVTKIDKKVMGLPNIPSEYLPYFKLISNKPIIPSDEELENNNRARSSKLRIIERIK